MAALATLVYGIVCYVIFFGTFLYAGGFLANLGVPKSVDVGGSGPVAAALVVNTALLLVFAIQHSGMARPGFKHWLTKHIPQPIERSTYVLASSIALILLFALWQPMPSVIWSITDPVAAGIVTALFGAGIGLVLYSTFLIDHFDLFGLRQVVLLWRGKPYEDKRFMTPGLYRFIRHPLYVGWFVTFWVTPHMTIGHLFLAGVVTLYVLAAIRYEERDLEQILGDEYRRWRERTPMFVPQVRPQAAAPTRTATQSR